MSEGLLKFDVDMSRATTYTIHHRFEPRGAIKQLFETRRPEVLVSGPAGTGKSRGCLEKLHMMMLVNPGARGLIVRKTLASLSSTALVTYREHVAREALDAGIVSFYGGSAQEPPQYRYANGSVIVIGGMDKATKIMSSEYDVAFAQEAIELTEDDVESITTRLRNRRISFQQLMMDTNPGPSHHWLKKRVDRGQTLMLESRHTDNPIYYDHLGQLTPAGRDYIVGKLDKLTGIRRARLRDGLWVSVEGLVYETWDPAVHVVDRFDIPPDWARYWAVDFGYTNPFVLQWWAEDPDGRLYLYRELYRTRRLVEDHVRDALAIVAPDGRDREWIEPKPAAIICDHDAEDRATFERHLGLKTIAAKKSISDGIQAVQSRLAVDGDKRPRLMMLRDSVVEIDQQLADAGKPTSTLEEITGYAWPTKRSALAHDRSEKEVPIKEDDHGMDAMRYMVAHKDLKKQYVVGSYRVPGMVR